MTASVIALHTSAPLSQLLVATTNIGRMTTPAGIAAGVEAERHSVPDADLCIAAVRRWAALKGDDGLRELCSYLDEILDT